MKKKKGSYFAWRNFRISAWSVNRFVRFVKTASRRPYEGVKNGDVGGGMRWTGRMNDASSSNGVPRRHRCLPRGRILPVKPLGNRFRPPRSRRPFPPQHRGRRAPNVRRDGGGVVPRTFYRFGARGTRTKREPAGGGRPSDGRENPRRVGRAGHP